MDTHFVVLGLRRGSSESDMKKAYHKKALEYHPDRNPAGAEFFKRVQAAYEALQRHYKTHGGVDMVPLSATVGSTPLFSEEELFGSAATEPRRFPHRPFRQRHAAPTTDQASGSTFFDWFHAAADERSRRAHGNRAPVSGYDPFNGAEDEMNAFASQAKHFEDMEKRKAKLAETARSKPTAGDSTAQGAQPSSTSSSSGSSSCDQPTPPPRTSRGGAPSSPPTATATSSASKGQSARPADKPCHQQLSEDWQSMRRDAAAIQRAEEEMAEAERIAKREQLERETREEWSRMVAEMEQKKLQEMSKKAEADTIQNLEQQKKTNMQLRELHKERRELKKELFARRMPTQGEVQRMSELELFVMQQVLEDATRLVSQTLSDRMRASVPCCICSAADKEVAGPQRFACRHRVTCTTCGRNAFSCPVCGADSLDLLHETL